jgi:hypothetical protein
MRSPPRATLQRTLHAGAHPFGQWSLPRSVDDLERETGCPVHALVHHTRQHERGPFSRIGSALGYRAVSTRRPLSTLRYFETPTDG